MEIFLFKKFKMLQNYSGLTSISNNLISKFSMSRTKIRKENLLNDAKIVRNERIFM